MMTDEEKHVAEINRIFLRELGLEMAPEDYGKPLQMRQEGSTLHLWLADE